MSRIDEALARARTMAPVEPPTAVELPAGQSPEFPPEMEPADEPVLPADPFSEVEAASAAGPGTVTGPDPAMPYDAVPDPRTLPLAEKLMLNASDPEPAEQYRRLAARLYLAQAQLGMRVVMVTSALSGEGKTLTATNLALTLSESYKKRVLLIDADLRRPWVHQIFQVPNVAGLNDGLRADVDRKVPIIRFTEHLSLLTAGRPEPDPMSVLTSDRMRRVLEDAARTFDWVIIATPPVGLLTAAKLLASLVDTVLLVVRTGKTPLHASKMAAEGVGRDRILGVVLNCADEALRGHVSRYYDSAYADAAGQSAQ
jgi:protein-tyrosine kinase